MSEKEWVIVVVFVLATIFHAVGIKYGTPPGFNANDDVDKEEKDKRE